MLYFLQLFSYQCVTLNQFSWMFFIINSFLKNVMYIYNIMSVLNTFLYV